MYFLYLFEVDKLVIMYLLFCQTCEILPGVGLLLFSNVYYLNLCEIKLFNL